MYSRWKQNPIQNQWQNPGQFGKWIKNDYEFFQKLLTIRDKLGNHKKI